jgi:hypothetical protein
MTDFADIASEYERIKDKPEVMDELRSTEAMKKTGPSADNTKIRQEVLPDDETHYRLQEKYTRMFDKSTRAGAKSKLHGLILPGGRKNFSDFHDNFTGTGRFKPQKAPNKVQLSEKGPKVDTPSVSVALYERCMDCLERVSKDDAVPNIIYLPPGDMMNPIARSKWASVQLKPGMILGYLFCSKCLDTARLDVKRILHDPFKSAIQLPAPGGKTQTLAEVEAHKYTADRGERISDNVFQQIKYHRDLPETDVFYGEAKLN